MPRPNWRDLPPVEPVDAPSRLSQTLLKNANGCMRSGYLYLKHGSAPSVELDRGTAYHLWRERALQLLLTHGEAVLEADVAKDLMDAVLDEHPELGVACEDAVKLRQMAYHMSGDDRGRAGQRKEDDRPYPVGYAWRTGEIAAVERTFVLDVEGWTIVGKVDAAHLGEDVVLDVADAKTSMSVPTAAEYVGSFQTKCYGALILFGRPVTRVTCGACAGDGGWGKSDDGLDCGECRGTGYTDLREPCIGDRIPWVRTSEVFPRYLRDDGTVVTRDAIYSRQEISEFMDDLGRLVRRVDQAFTDWRWPAIRGTHCSMCPCKPQCPLPEELRSHAGEINDLKRASEALEWTDAQSDLIRATRKEVREFARRQQLTIPVGRDEEYVFEVRDARKVNVEGIQMAAERAAQFGEPFDAEEYVKRSTSTNFVKQKREAAVDA